MSNQDFDDLPIERQLAATCREIDRLQQRMEANETLLAKLVEEREFLLPYAARFILERQLCIENPGMHDARESFEVMMKLTRSDMAEVIDMVISSQRVDLLQKLMENK
jgi:hypothetical protein